LTDSLGEDSDGRYSRFEESGKWIAEMGEQHVEVKSLAAGETSSEDFMSGALATLGMLDEKVEKIDVRLGQIETRMKELEKEEKEAEGMEKEKEPSKQRKRKDREEGSNGLRRSKRLRSSEQENASLGKGCSS
jgi:hypothetical protein